MYMYLCMCRYMYLDVVDARSLSVKLFEIPAPRLILQRVCLMNRLAVKYSP